MEATKRPTRDYPSYSSTPWELWKTIYARRSNRKYLPLELDDGFMESLKETADLAASVRGVEEGGLLVVTDGDKVERIRKRAYKGFQGKINLWLMRAPLKGFLVLALPKKDVESRRPGLLPLVSMAAEDCILWLTEAGLGTCWLGGINQKEVKEVMGLGKDMAVPAIICFGKPKPRVKARDLDHVMYRTISRHRKPLDEIAYVESMDSSYPLRELPKEPFSASPIQDISGLLSKLAEKGSKSGEVPLDLVIDACLESARVAPSANNSQKWRFVVVTGEERLGKLAEACGEPGMWKAAIVGAGQPGSIETLMLNKPFWMLDLPIALSHMSLMAASMGCGVELYINEFREEEVNRLAGLSQKIRSVGVLGIK